MDHTIPLHVSHYLAGNKKTKLPTPNFGEEQRPLIGAVWGKGSTGGEERGRNDYIMSTIYQSTPGTNE